MPKRKHKPEHIGFCALPTCSGLLYPQHEIVPHTASYFERMHTPLNPHAGPGQEPDSMLIGYACDQCGLLYAHVPDARVTPAELARRQAQREGERQYRLQQINMACEQLKPILDRNNVRFNQCELMEALQSITDESLAPLPYENISHGVLPKGAPVDPESVQQAIDGIGLWHKIGDACRPAVDWDEVDQEGIDRFASRIVRLFRLSDVWLSGNVNHWHLRGTPDLFG